MASQIEMIGKESPGRRITGFGSVIASTQQQALFSMNLMRYLSLAKSIARQNLVQAEHLAFVQALKGRDAPAAGAAMHLHLENAQDRMFGK